jgi:Uma2 family endonuclease
MFMAETPVWTPEMVFALPDDGRRYEIVDGALVVTPSPGFEHQEALGRLYVALRLYAAREPDVIVVSSPADLRGPRTMVQPDLYAVRRDLARTPFPWPLGQVLLAVEVLSPSNRRHDLVTKQRLYQEAGIPLYWIVDPDEQCVHAWHRGAPEAIICRDELRWRPEGSATIFRYPLSELFAPV